MIKRSPADFRVEEVLDPAVTSSVAAAGPFALYTLEKESLATPEAVGQIARAMTVPAGAIAYAGLKDKHASTLQAVTLKMEEGRSAPDELSGVGWKIQRLGFVPRSITAADIQCNRFRILLRNLTAANSFDIQEAVRLLSTPDGLRIVNYFGDQRFGSARHGRGFMAKHLIKGDFEGALRLAIAVEARKDRMSQKVFKRTLREHWGRWREVLPKLRRCPERKPIERLANSSGDFRAAFTALPYLLQQLSVYAYQSHLWNAIARGTIARHCTGEDKVIAAEDVFGEMLFPIAEAAPRELVEAQIPLLSRKTLLAEPWREAAIEVLMQEGITLSELAIPGVRRPFFGEEPRALFFTASEFQLSPAEPDETATDKSRVKRSVSFSLPRGSYATVVLRALGQ
ncbi:MAG TPA: tRNA pseudouridine(13) synthase TruD [Planctomycetota bacterium]|jgi:tRNA pseudouridine13 synthase